MRDEWPLCGNARNPVGRPMWPPAYGMGLYFRYWPMSAARMRMTNTRCAAPAKRDFYEHASFIQVVGGQARIEPPTRRFSSAPPTAIQPLRRTLFTAAVRPVVGLPAGLHESQCHPIRLADRQILVAIFITEPERRRQGPHAFRIVLGVLRVVVDRRFRIEAEACSPRQFLDVVLVHVAGLTHLLETGARLGAVLDHTEHATRLQSLEECVEVRLLIARC